MPDSSDMAWNSYVAPFSHGLWLAVATATCALTVFLALTNTSHGGLERNQSLTVAAIFFYILGCLCQQGQAEDIKSEGNYSLFHFLFTYAYSFTFSYLLIYLPFLLCFRYFFPFFFIVLCFKLFPSLSLWTNNKCIEHSDLVTDLSISFPHSTEMTAFWEADSHSADQEILVEGYEFHTEHEIA
jgi:hypothetical protein